MISLDSKLINNDSLFNYIFIFDHAFPIVPKDNKHLGACIAYQDLAELRKPFVTELYDTIAEWVYSLEKFEAIKHRLQSKGKSEVNATSAIIRLVKEKFRRSDNDALLIQGQFGELLLFHFLQRYFHAIPLLRKMPITTSPKHERFGADAIHFRYYEGKNIIYLGEAKTYSSSHTFNQAFGNSIDSILDTYMRHRDEFDLYIHEDFLDDDMNEIANKYIDNKLDNVEIHLVCIVIYNEQKELQFDNEASIQQQIDKIITEKFEKFDNSKIPISKHSILARITYIIFPIWKLEELLRCFQDYLKN